MKIFPDSGAAICLAGTKHLPKLNINMDQLIPCTKVVSAVGGSKLKCNGWLPIKFQIGTQVTTQPLYICDKVDRIYFSCQGCLETNIILPSFLYPMEKPTTKHDIATIATQQVPPTNPPPPPSLPTYPPPPSPPPLPYPLTPDNIPKLKTCLLEQFRNTTFNMKSPFPAMNSKPAHIHLKPYAKPYVRHTPIHIPIHWKQVIRDSLNCDVDRDIITPVPAGTPAEWCSPMVVTTKKDETPRTVDPQHLNAQCLRETHHTQSPFQAASQIPPNTFKTVLDAVDGHYTMLLDKESQPLTIFITKWGHYMYLHLTQGYLASGDAYTRWYDELIKEVSHKIKIVDDCLLYDHTIEQDFYHV